MNEQMILWTATVAVLVLAFCWTVYEKWHAAQRAEEKRLQEEMRHFIFNADHAYKYDYEDFDDYEDEL